MTKIIGMERGELLETTQAKNTLSSCRVPGLETDTLSTFSESRHVVVLHKGSAYKVDVIQANGQPLSAEEIYQQLRAVTMARREDASPSIAPFTALDRPTWASMRESLIQRGASESINVMESAILALSLEERTAPDTRSEVIEATRLGNNVPQQARYYDKTINLVVFKDGKAGILMEHTILLYILFLLYLFVVLFIYVLFMCYMLPSCKKKS
ncbi:carnitine O-acetyltransferase-like [Amphiura filiformis]|uniref:carnitine O-acetyltransferase-like n=1 Tax=Amphiura filiformis TaxID=82378 RepID=UPI003B20F265